MKFKVGDRVKRKETEGIYKITKIDENNAFYNYLAKDKEGRAYWFTEEDLKKIEYTYEDLKKSPIGTKITFENGEVSVKDDDGNYSNKKRWRDDSDLKELKDRINTLGKIIKIEEPTYQTVYEVKQEILDEAEKRYLRNIVRPFRDKVDCIIKNRYKTKNLEYIVITIKGDVDLEFPYFKEGTMYRGMKLNTGYTLEELEL